ncbi:RNA polymerase sigma factor [Falsiroseomonas sp. HC035]|uniref:RNA polymerase sigma factor n=1 Tax=Falsiroseomonas sp. HC035 TaxID=3390999 RepID=UPI003D30EFAF
MDGARQAAIRAAELAARSCYGRLVARLAARSRDIAGAEDALAEAFAAALRTWPERGVPTAPEAWLLTAARNAQTNAGRHRRVRDAAAAEIERRQAEREARDASFPDERLKLLFVCAHPAIDAAVRTPLMLQAVLGLDAARIAAAFLVAPAAMGQRLVRAKAKIRDAGLRFAVPEPEDMPGRLAEVLAAIYAAYGTGWEARQVGLAEEAIYLGRLVVELLPAEPEARGLLALMLYCEARREARRDAAGRFVPLARQDARLWSGAMIAEAEALLAVGARAGRFGRYLCEAAIQSVHIQRPVTGRTDYRALRLLYDLLAAHEPSLGVLVARAALLLEAGDAAAARVALDALEGQDMAGYQPYWVALARLLRAEGQAAEAELALSTALSLTDDVALREFLSLPPP